ncbi:MAG: TRAP transporter small permease [Alphaproteobacteria bacterium]|nr:TRAP transporter small permease [Alphaproteobacteria bacterium]
MSGPSNGQPDDTTVSLRGVVAPDWMLNIFKVTTATSIFAIAILTFTDVVMRYFLSAPLRGVYEMDGLILGLMTMSALPLVTESRAHITVDVLDHFYHGGLRFSMQLLSLVFQAVMIGFITWRLYAIALREWNNGWVTIDLQISRAPLLFILAALGAASTLIVIVMIVQMWRGRLPVIPHGGLNDGSEDML